MRTKIIHLLLAASLFLPIWLITPSSVLGQLALPEFDFPYASDMEGQIKWTGGPHEYGDLDLTSIYLAGLGSGIDFACDCGFAVKPIASGIVIYAGHGGLGNMVAIKHDVGGSVAIYGHLAQINVIVGDHVSHLVTIGTEGSTGTDHRHLHVELRANDTCYVNCVAGTDSNGNSINVGGNPLGWDMGISIGGYSIHGYYIYVGSGGEPYGMNYDGSAVRGQAVPFQGFKYKDSDGSTNFVSARVSDGYQCDVSSVETCENNEVDEDIKFAVAGDGSSVGGPAYLISSMSLPGGGNGGNPVEPNDTITIHDGANYEGTHYGWHDPGDWPAPDYLYNSVTSIGVVPEGWSILLYDEPDQTGAYICITENEADLADNVLSDGTPANDTTESVRVFNDDDCGGIGSGQFLPDLVAHPLILSSVSGTSQNGDLRSKDPVFVDYQMENASGSQVADTFDVQITIGTKVVLTQNINSMSPGEIVSAVDIETLIGSPGWFFVEFVVDPYNTVNESNETNNVWQAEVFLDENMEKAVIFTGSSSSIYLLSNWFDDGDILAYNPASMTWFPFLLEDLLDVSYDLDCYILNDEDLSMYVSTDNDEDIPGINEEVQAADIFLATPVSLDPLSLGIDTDVIFTPWFIGAEHRLDSSDNIDACAVYNGRLVVSFDDDVVINNVEYFENDLLAINLDSSGNPTGDWQLFLKGDSVGITENINGLWFSYYGDIYMTIDDFSFNFGGVSGDRDDVFLCQPLVENGVVISCTFEKYWDGDNFGMWAETLDVLHLDS